MSLDLRQSVRSSISLAVVSTVIVSAWCQAATVAVRPTSPLSTDIAGIRLNMTKERALATLQSTYRCEPFGHTKSFAERVQEAVAQRKGLSPFSFGGDGTMQLLCKGPNNEDLTIDLAQVATGDIVNEIKLLIPGETVDQPALRKQISVKYGKPTVGDGKFGSWCDAGYRCGDSIILSVGPELTVQAFGSDTTIMATRGDRAEKADKAAVQAAADKLAPKRSTAAF